MPIDDATLHRSALFKVFWETADPDLSNHGLNELTPDGARKLKDFALGHESDGSVSPANSREIDQHEKEVVRTLLDHQRYGAFMELDGRAALSSLFDIRGADGMIPGSGPTEIRRIALPDHVSRVSQNELSRIDARDLPRRFSEEYRQNRNFFESTGLSAEERSRRTLGLLRDYSEALWSRGERPDTERIGGQLLDAFEQTRYGRLLGAENYGRAPWSVAQGLVLGVLNPNAFQTHFPDARSDVPTTYLNMSTSMAGSMKFVDEFRLALGYDAGAEDHELRPVLNHLIGERSGHNKPGSLTESRPFGSTGVNWGIALFRGDGEIRNLPVKEGFELPLDVVDAFGRMVRIDPGDRIEVVDQRGNPVNVEKVIHRDDAGKAISWSARFTDPRTGEELGPQELVGLVKNAFGVTEGDGRTVGSVSMGWWGFCDRNTAQKLYKAAYGIPQLDAAETVRVRAGDRIVEVPVADAQKLIDMDISDLVTGESFRGFRYNEEPQRITLANGESFVGKVDYSSVQAAKQARRLGGDTVEFSGFSRPVTVELQNGEKREIPAAEVKKIVGETQHELSLSSFLTYVSANDGMYATDASTGPIVSNGMRWTNHIDFDVRAGEDRPEWAGAEALAGVHGPLERADGDQIAWVRGMYSTEGNAEGWAAFSGWMQLSKSGRILNEGFIRGEPDFAWGASGPLNWSAQSSFNPYMVPEMRLGLLINGVKDLATDTENTEALAQRLNLPNDWRNYRTAP